MKKMLFICDDSVCLLFLVLGKEKLLNLTNVVRRPGWPGIAALRCLKGQTKKSGGGLLCKLLWPQ